MKNVKVYDCGEGPIDRYQVFIEGNFYAMSSDPLSPLGFNQYMGTGGPKSYDLVRCTEVDFEELPKEVQKAIRLRIAD